MRGQRLPHVPAGTRNRRYLEAFEGVIRPVTRPFRPELILAPAGHHLGSGPHGQNGRAHMMGPATGGGRDRTVGRDRPQPVSRRPAHQEAGHCYRGPALRIAVWPYAFAGPNLRTVERFQLNLRRPPRVDGLGARRFQHLS
jgi:hypothetical protein